MDFNRSFPYAFVLEQLISRTLLNKFHEKTLEENYWSCIGIYFSCFTNMHYTRHAKKEQIKHSSL